MYKVKQEDIIPTRTQEEVQALDKKKGGLSGATKQSAKKGHKLLSQFLAIAKTLDASKIVELVDLAHKIADLANASSRENAICTKGCSHCCKVNVDISVLEAAYIESKTNYQVVERPYYLKAGNKNIPYCPFHDEETATCLIHEYRPMACRGFFAFDDPKFCIGNDQDHFIMTAFHLPTTKQIIGIMDSLVDKKPGDIRSFFQPVKG